MRGHVELLQHFGFDEFTSEDFVRNLKNEIDGIVHRATHMDFDWDGMDLSRLFSTRLQRRRQRASDADNVDEDWRKDAGERAYRIWEWWRPIVADGTDFPCFSKTLQLIGLLQVSSCAVERVFSVLQRIREVCSDSMLEDMLQVRLFARCNGDIRGLYYLQAVQHPLEDVP